jgi:mono/diheme cytochrome c family protein
MAKYLSGVDCFLDGLPAADGGCIGSANLTNDATGLRDLTDAQIKAMFLDGKTPEGKAVVPVMPYYVFHNMTADDANAIVAYLRTVPAVAHKVAEPEAPFDNVPVPAAPIDPATIPTTDAGASAERGRYLAAMAGVCMDCHTPELPFGSVRPIDMTKPFAGNRPFGAASLHLPSPPLPAIIYSANITPHPTGIAGWTAADVVKVLKQAKDRDGGSLCPPMPAGPMGSFGGLTDQDALDIATYIISLPPIDNPVTDGNGSCVGP